MQYDVKTPQAYLKTLEKDWRRDKLLQVREIIWKYAPGLSEGIQYKMLAYSNSESAIFHLNAQQAYVSLYLGDVSKIAGAQELLQPFDVGKGCIRIRKNVEIEKTELDTFIKKVIALYEAGGNTSC